MLLQMGPMSGDNIRALLGWDREGEAGVHEKVGKLQGFFSRETDLFSLFPKLHANILCGLNL